MSDEAAAYYHQNEVDFASERRRFARGLLVVSVDGEEGNVTAGRFCEPGRSSTKTCRLCGEPNHLQANCPNKSALQNCNNCHQPGHIRGECPDRLCLNCRKTGHGTRECEEPERCRICRQEGHRARKCPNRGNPRFKSCSNCSRVGHVLSECTEGPQAKSSSNPTSKSSSEPVPKGQAQHPVGEAPDKWEPVEIAASSSGETSGSGSRGCSEPAAEAAPEPPATSPDDEGELPPPKGIADSPPGNLLDVKMHTIASNNHLSAIGFTLEGHFDSDKHFLKSGREDKLSSFYVAGDNFLAAGCGLAADIIDPRDEAFTKHVLPEQAKRVQENVGDGETTQLVHVHMKISTAAAMDGAEVYAEPATPRPLRGLGMFVDADYGPLQAQYTGIRDRLTSKGIIRIDFFTLGTQDEVARVLGAYASMRGQVEDSPLRRWWQTGKINPQLGQEIKIEDRPRDFRIEKRFSFASYDEWVTVHYHNLISEYEDIRRKGYVLTTLRLATFPGGDQQLYYGHLDCPADTHYREGASVKIKLTSPDAADDEDWTFKVVQSFGYASAMQYSGFAYRARMGRAFVKEPQLAEGVHYIDTVDHGSTAELRVAMQNLPGILCYVRETQPRSGVKKAINTINHLHLGGAAFARERQLLLANDLRSLPVVDYFAALQGIIDEADIVKELETMREGLNEEQQRVVDALRAMKGGFLLVHGPGGTGKTEILVGLNRLQYRLRCKHGDQVKALGRIIGGLWVVSSINKQLDDVAQKIYDALEEERARMGPLGKPVVVIRRYEASAEKHVYRRHAQEAGDKVTKMQRPLYYDEDVADLVEAGKEFTRKYTDLPPEVFDLITAVRLQGPFSAPEAEAFDSRIKLEFLSEGAWTLRRSGVEEHAISDKANHRDFRHLLHQISRGTELSLDEMSTLTLHANAISRELAQLADAVCMTPHVAAQHRAHSLQQPFAVLHDEAGKAPEVGTLAPILFSRPYEQGGGPLRISPDSHVPHVLFGDVYQPAPVLGRDTEKHPLGQQASVSLFERLYLAGVPCVSLWTQQRSNQCIVDLNNHSHPRGHMRVADSVERRDASIRAKECAEELFGSKKRAVFLHVRGATETLPTTKSRYNDGFVIPSVAAVCKILRSWCEHEGKRGFAGEDIGIIAAYVGQVATYRFLVNQYRDWLLAHAQDSIEFQLGVQLGQVDVFTIDKMQGAQKEVVVHCTTTSDSLGFTFEATRQLLANGRARSLLIIVGDPTGVEASFDGKKGSPFRSTAYYKAWYWCVKNRSVVNLSLNDGRSEDWQLPLAFGAQAALNSFHSETGDPAKAIRLDPDAVYAEMVELEAPLEDDEGAAVGGSENAGDGEHVGGDCDAWGAANTGAGDGW